MATQNTIPLNHKYTFNVSKMDNISIGDMFKGENALRGAVIENYRDTNPSGGTKELIDGVIKHFLTHETAKPNSYQIIITHKTQSQNIDLSQFEQTNRENLIYKKHIDTLFQHYITTQL